MNTRAETLPDMAEEVLATGVVCLTGGHDVAKNPFITFPASTHSHLESWNSDRLERVLRCYVAWLSVTSQVRSVACLADMQHASKCVITIVVDALEKLELNSRGTVSAVYFLKPQNKARSKMLKKLLGMKPSKKHPKIPLFKVLLLKTYQELFSQIDLSHLTSDLGGTLHYDHMAWMKLYEMVTPCVRRVDTVLRKVPDLRDKVELLQDYETEGCSVADLQTLLAQLTESYQQTVHEAHFREILDRCKQVLLVLDSVDEDSSERWLARVHDKHVHNAGECVRARYKELAAQQWQLEDLWKKIEENITVHLQIQKHRERSLEIEKRVVTHFEPLLQEHPSVGSTLSQAELYRTHFTTTLYEPAKELLSQATEILEDVLRLRERVSTPCDVTDILQMLTVSMQPFTQKLQTLQDVYVAVHIFHLLFQKALTWYRKVLKFLPDSLQERAAEEGEGDSSSGKATLQMPREWQDTVHSFLAKHPPPQEQHLARLDTEIPAHVEKRLRVQARSLALRLRLLQRLLFSRRIPVKLLTTVFQWRAEALSSSGLSGASPTKEKTPHAKTPRQPGHFQFPNTPPPKPARMFDAIRPLSSFSSSDAGDPEHRASRSRNVGDRPGRSSQRKSVTQGHAGGVRDSAGADPAEENGHDEKSSSDGVMGYVPPPRIAVKIAGATDESVSTTNDQSEQTEPAEVDREDSDETDERFISLADDSVRDAREEEEEEEDSFDSEDVAFRFTDIPTGSESGIEVAENEDPWNSIIDRIKAVSNSNLPSDVKIQCMSHLLSTSHSKKSDSLQRPTRDKSDYPRFRGDGRGGRMVTGFPLNQAGFDRFQHHIDYSQDPEVRRHKSFAIARDDVRLFHKKRQEEELASHSGSELYNRRRGGRDAPTSLQIRNPALFTMNHEEKPALAVLKMRHRLARSLMDLDALDYEEDSDDISARSRQQKYPRALPGKHSRAGMGSAFELSAPRFSYGRRGEEDVDSYQERHSKDSAVSSLTRSYAGELDTAHLPSSRQDRRQRGKDRGLVGEETGYPLSKQDSPRKLNSWRSHGDGLDTIHHRNQQQQQSPQNVARSSGTPAASKSSSRWRQGIVDGDHLPSPTKAAHHKSNDFIAPSFLKPFRSVDNLHQVGSDRPMGGGASSGSSDSHRDDVEARGLEAVDRDSDSPTEPSFCESAGVSYRSPDLERLSDQVDQESVSQDSVESSLKRSQRILRDAEESFQRQSSQEVDTSASPSLDSEDLQPLPPTVAKNIDPSEYPEVSIKADRRKQPEGLERESSHGEKGEPVEIEIHDVPPHIVNNDSAGDNEEDADDAFWEEDSTVASELPERARSVSGGLTADYAGWDADVSNMSDACPAVNQLY